MIFTLWLVISFVVIPMPKFIDFGISVKSRLNILSEHIDNITKSERSALKNAIRNATYRISLDTLYTLIDNTPRRPDEDSSIYGYRQAAWDKYGVQDYIHIQSPSPSERVYGIHLQDGWITPTLDFTGSTKNTIRYSTSFQNRSPHARLALLGEYNKSSWEIPGTNGMYGGRKLMMWQGSNGNPVFRWVIVNNQKSSNVGPITYRHGAPVTKPILAAQRLLEQERIPLVNDVIRSIKDSFNTL